MFGLFNNTPPVDADASRWLLDAFDWALQNFEPEFFGAHPQLVLPSADHFPGKADSIEGMANMVFDKVKAFAGVAHWPTLLVDQTVCPVMQLSQVEIHGALRGPDGVANAAVAAENRLQIPFNPQQVNQPEALIASFAYGVAHHLGPQARTTPPGGPEHQPLLTELLAIYLGFGLMFANSAFTFRGGCGSCYNPAANRHAALSETESTYALAIFATLKDIPDSAITRHLKKHLRGVYRRSLKDLQAHEDELNRMRTRMAG